MEVSSKVKTICESGHDKKADNIVVMEMTGKSSICDTFVVMSAPSSVRVKAIADHIEESLRGHGVRIRHKEGYSEAVWVLMDFGEVIVHIFQEEARHFYSLEHLWGDAPKRHFFK